MKPFIIFLLLVAISLPQEAYSQTRSTNKFYRKYKYKKNVTNLNLPGWLIRLGVNIASIDVDEEEKAALGLAKKIRKIKLLVNEDGNPIKKADLADLTKGMQKESFEPLIHVREGKTKIDLFLREKRDIIKNMVILVQEEDEFIFLSLKTRLKIEDINELLHLMEDDYDIDIPLPTKEAKPVDSV